MSELLIKNLFNKLNSNHILKPCLCGQMRQGSISFGLRHKLLLIKNVILVSFNYCSQKNIDCNLVLSILRKNASQDILLRKLSQIKTRTSL
jgi:hypothetical protein